MQEIKFIRKWVEKDDDSYYIVAVDSRLPKEVFMACFKAGAVKKVYNEDFGTLWDWDEQKATPILQKFGYRVVSLKQAEEEERKSALKEELQKKIEDPNTYIPNKKFESEYAGYSYSSIIKVNKIFSEQEKEVTLSKEGVTVTGKAKIMLAEGVNKRVFDGQEFSKTGKFLIVQINEKRFFAEIE